MVFAPQKFRRKKAKKPDQNATLANPKVTLVNQKDKLNNKKEEIKNTTIVAATALSA